MGNHGFLSRMIGYLHGVASFEINAALVFDNIVFGF